MEQNVFSMISAQDYLKMFTLYPFANHYATLPYCFVSQNQQESVEVQNLTKIEETEAKEYKVKKCKESALEKRRKRTRKLKMIKKREREDNYDRKKQKQGRNYPSDIFKYFLTYLYNHPKRQALLYVYSTDPMFNPNLFLQKLQNYVRPTQCYIRPSSIIDLLCQNNSLCQQERLIFRIILKRFLLLELSLVISPMKKYKRTQKRGILKCGRTLWQEIQSKLKE